MAVVAMVLQAATTEAMAVAVCSMGTMAMSTTSYLLAKSVGSASMTRYVCYHRFDHLYQPKDRGINFVSTSYQVDTNWYANSGATDHITSDLDRPRGECFWKANVKEACIRSFHLSSKSTFIFDFCCRSCQSRQVASAVQTSDMLGCP